jgi:hypothetical protein
LRKIVEFNITTTPNLVAVILNRCPFVGHSSTCYSKNLRKMQKKFEKIFFFKNFELFRVISPNATRLLSGKKNQAGSPVTELHFDTKLAYTL